MHLLQYLLSSSCRVFINLDLGVNLAWMAVKGINWNFLGLLALCWGEGSEEYSDGFGVTCLFFWMFFILSADIIIIINGVIIFLVDVLSLVSHPCVMPSLAAVLAFGIFGRVNCWSIVCVSASEASFWPFELNSTSFYPGWIVLLLVTIQSLMFGALSCEGFLVEYADSRWDQISHHLWKLSSFGLWCFPQLFRGHRLVWRLGRCQVLSHLCVLFHLFNFLKQSHEDKSHFCLKSLKRLWISPGVVQSINGGLNRSVMLLLNA